MSNIEYLYPYNPLGNREDCIIKNEILTIDSTKGEAYTFIIPRSSPFFANGLIVKSLKEDRILEFNIDYILTHKFRKASKQLNKEIYGSITFLDKSISGGIDLTYSTLGGDFTNRQEEALVKTVKLMTEHRIIDWEDIIDKPISFIPSPHTHTPDQILDMNDVVVSIDNIANLIRGDEYPNHRHTIDQIDELQSLLDSKVDNANNTVFAPCSPIDVRGGTNVVLLTIPKSKITLGMRMELWISNNEKNSNLIISAILEPNMAESTNISNLDITADNNEFTDRISGYYNNQGFPIIGFETSKSAWEDCTFTIPKVTYTEIAKEQIEGNVYSVESGTTLVGNIIVIETTVNQLDYQKVLDRLHRVKINTILDEIIYDII